MKKQGLGREEYRRLWEARLRDLEESDLTQKQWCEQNGVSLSTLKYWILKENKEKKQRTQKGDTKWLAVEMGGSSEPYGNASLSAKVAVNYGAFRVEVEEGATPEQVYSVLRVLKEL